MKPISILYLYPDEMNFYGDTGNVLALRRRLEWRGYKTELIYHHVGQKLSYAPDIIVGGGGQDSGQQKIYADLLTISDKLHELADNGVPMLAVCGMYQLFGKRFVTMSGDSMEGVGLFDAETYGMSQRLIGHVRISTAFGELVGFENHSGQTFLSDAQPSFGDVIDGFGNNSEALGEGAVYMNTFGTYLHGPLLPRNPTFADYLILKALQRHDPSITELEPIADDLSDMSYQHALHTFFRG